MLEELRSNPRASAAWTVGGCPGCGAIPEDGSAWPQFVHRLSRSWRRALHRHFWPSCRWAG